MKSRFVNGATGSITATATTSAAVAAVVAARMTERPESPPARNASQQSADGQHGVFAGERGIVVVELLQQARRRFVHADEFRSASSQPGFEQQHANDDDTNSKHDLCQHIGLVGTV